MKERKTIERIEKEIWDVLCVDLNPKQGDLLSQVTGKTTLKLQVLNQMEAAGKVAAEPDGKALRYRAVVPKENVKGEAA
jgi:hypothetical protein